MNVFEKLLHDLNQIDFAAFEHDVGILSKVQDYAEKIILNKLDDRSPKKIRENCHNGIFTEYAAFKIIEAALIPLGWKVNWISERDLWWFDIAATSPSGRTVFIDIKWTASSYWVTRSAKEHNDPRTSKVHYFVFNPNKQLGKRFLGQMHGSAFRNSSFPNRDGSIPGYGSQSKLKRSVESIQELFVSGSSNLEPLS